MKGLVLLGLVVLLSFHKGECRESAQSCEGYDCLKAYVDKPDPAYQWEDTGHRLVVADYLGRGGWTGYFLNMTSQAWLTPEDTSQHLWWHIMVVIVPDNIEVFD